jgi:FAD/FMN-containing dehydrogenase
MRMSRQPIAGIPEVSGSALERFRSSFRGELVLPSDEPYEAARRVWNASVDKRPALIARCSGVVDVVRAVEFAREHEMLAAVRGGAHNVAGHGTCDGGIVVDLSRMRGIRLDLVKRTVRVEAGATWGDLDHETQAYGLATTGGMVSTTGVAGFTLGGGIGWLMRKHGLACDNVLAVDIVTAGGRVLPAGADENADLFWGVRGGGGNFGIATSFELQLYPVGPVVTAGAIFFGAEHAGDVLRFYRDWVEEEAPDELTTLVSLATAPPAPFLPEEIHGRPVVIVVGCYSGESKAATRAFRPLKELGSPISDLIGPMPYTAMQTFVDPLWGPGAQNYFKSGYLRALDDEAIEALLRSHERVTSPRSEIHVHNLGGAVARVAEDQTAFGQRDAPYLLNVLARWLEPGESDGHTRWARELYASLTPSATGRAYVNFLGEEGHERVKSAYGEHTFERLVALKNAYDPTNFFRVNQNIPPNGSPSAQPRPDLSCRVQRAVHATPGDER